jgi:hypothetical protein
LLRIFGWFSPTMIAMISTMATVDTSGSALTLAAACLRNSVLATMPGAATGTCRTR